MSELVFVSLPFLRSTTELDSEFLLALPGPSTIRCFGRLGAGEGTKLLVFGETFWGLKMNLQNTWILMTKTPGILHTLGFLFEK